MVERARTTRRFIKLTNPPYAISDLEIIEIEKDGDSHLPEVKKHMLSGKSIGLISESGMPAIADPGSEIVALAHRLGCTVKPLIGPSSIFLALAASGLNGQSFSFQGYLPIKEAELKAKLKSLESQTLKVNQTHIFIETPYRNNRLIHSLLKYLSGTIKLCVAADITGPNESIQTRTIAQWKSSNLKLEKIPTIFLIG